MIKFQIRIVRGKHEDKIPYSRLAVSYVLFMASAILFWACYEMHRLDDLTPLAYIGAGVVALIASALGFYVWRAKKTDDFVLALEKAKAEKELGVKIETENIEEESEEAIG